MNEEMLIRLVRHYEFLYDYSLPKNNDPKKDAAWNEISQVMNQPGLWYFTIHFLILNLARKVLHVVN